MASIHKDISTRRPPRRRLVPRCAISARCTRLGRALSPTRLDGDARIVTFANGNVARELLVDCDEARRRLVYAVVSERVKQHSASVQVSPTARRAAGMVWIADVLPNEIAPYIDGQMDLGARRCRSSSGERGMTAALGFAMTVDTAGADLRNRRRPSVPTSSAPRSRRTACRAPPSTPPPAQRSSRRSLRASTATSRRRRRTPAARSAPAPDRTPSPRPARKNTSRSTAR